MKNLVLFVFFSAAFAASGQRAPYVRVIDTNNVVIARGRLAGCSDSMLVVHQKNIDLVVDVQRIRKVKTGRSAGHHVLVGTLIGIGTGMVTNAIFGIIGTSVEGEISGFSVASGMLTGAPAGATIGGVVGIFTRKKVYAINSSPAALASFGLAAGAGK